MAAIVGRDGCEASMSYSFISIKWAQLNEAEKATR